MDRQHVLIVEDEAGLRLLLEDVLAQAGFAVTVVANGEKAIEHLERQDPAPVALVTDVHLTQSGLTGWDVARTAREQDGDLAVVYMTGEAASDWPSNGVPNSVLITKPFAPAQVVTAISNLLNAASATGA